MKHFLLFLFLLTSLSTSAQKISYIEATSSWYIIYDQNGKRIRSFSTSQGRLVAYTSTFYIIQQGKSWYYTYDIEGHRLHSFSVAATGEILSASGDTFIARNQSWIYTWTKDGKRIASRSASTYR